MSLKRKITAGVASLFLLTGLAPAASAAELVVGGKNFTEQLVLAEMTTQLLQSHGHQVTKRDGMGTTIVRAALERGEVDLYWEYTGTSLIVFNDVTEMLPAEETYQRVKELDGAKGLVWLQPSKANNTYAMAIRRDNPKTEGMETISDLAAAYNAGNALLMGTTAEFPRRNDGLLSLQETYGFEVGRSNIRAMDIGLAYVALANEDLDVMSAQATDGQIAALDLVLLEDDKEFFPNYALTPVVREDTLAEVPELKEILEGLSTRLDDSVMQRLNGQVDVDRQSIEEVARNYLEEEGLI